LKLILKEAKVLHGPCSQLTETEWWSYSFIMDRSQWWHNGYPTQTVICRGGKDFSCKCTASYMLHIDPNPCEVSILRRAIHFFIRQLVFEASLFYVLYFNEMRWMCQMCDPESNPLTILVKTLRVFPRVCNWPHTSVNCQV
jgi:hypothetical protein